MADENPKSPTVPLSTTLKIKLLYDSLKKSKDGTLTLSGLSQKFPVIIDFNCNVEKSIVFAMNLVHEHYLAIRYYDVTIRAAIHFGPVLTLEEYINNLNDNIVKSVKLPQQKGTKHVDYDTVHPEFRVIFRSLIRFVAFLHKKGMSMKAFTANNVVFVDNVLKVWAVTFVEADKHTMLADMQNIAMFIKELCPGDKPPLLAGLLDKLCVGYNSTENYDRFLENHPCLLTPSEMISMIKKFHDGITSLPRSKKKLYKTAVESLRAPLNGWRHKKSGRRRADGGNSSDTGGSATGQSHAGSTIGQSRARSATNQSRAGSATGQSHAGSATSQSRAGSAIGQSRVGSATVRRGGGRIIRSVRGGLGIVGKKSGSGRAVGGNSSGTGGSATGQSHAGSATGQSRARSATSQSRAGSATGQSRAGSATGQSLADNATVRRGGGRIIRSVRGGLGIVGKKSGSGLAVGGNSSGTGGSATGQSHAGSATGQSRAGSATGQSRARSATSQSCAGSATGQSHAGSATGQSRAGSVTGQSRADSATVRRGGGRIIRSVRGGLGIVGKKIGSGRAVGGNSSGTGGSATGQSHAGSATGQSHAGSATGQSRAGSATGQSRAGSATSQSSAGSATGQSRAGSATVRRVGGRIIRSVRGGLGIIGISRGRGRKASGTGVTSGACQGWAYFAKGRKYDGPVKDCYNFRPKYSVKGGESGDLKGNASLIKFWRNLGTHLKDHIPTYAKSFGDLEVESLILWFYDSCVLEFVDHLHDIDIFDHFV